MIILLVVVRLLKLRGWLIEQRSVVLTIERLGKSRSRTGLVPVGDPFSLMGRLLSSDDGG